MDGSDNPAVGFLLLCIFVVINAIHYGFGAALQEVSESWLEESAKEGDKRAKDLLAWKTDPIALIQTIQVVTAVSYLILGAVLIRFGGIGFDEMLKNTSVGTTFGAALLYWGSRIINLVLYMFIMISFGTVVPKIFGVHRPQKWVFRYCGLIKKSITVMRPLTYLVAGFSNLTVKLFGIDPYKMQDDVTEEEIISMVNEGHEQGVLLASEAEMIQNIFEFGDKEAQDIMTHRKNIIALDGAQSLNENLKFMLQSSNSRFPVYLENIDNIIGILHLKDAMKAQMLNQYGDWLLKDIPDLIRQAVFIPETRNINVLFKNMQLRKIQMVIVLDEYGQTAGLVALEDILEEIVGNIQDEYDEDEAFIEKIGENTYLMKGLTPLEDVAEVLDIDLEEEEYETLNGFLVYRLDKVPEEDEHSEIIAKGYSFQILSVANKIIDKVKVTKLPQNQEKEKEETEKE
ncbi:MAG: hemolysin family protein [Lachnospiraceae bacterium]|nr:hemolysin family protein [Robinsoniella sp.]MDY3765439.1 hemolysin family protein [Lachnospiraceae bacterium]